MVIGGIRRGTVKLNEPKELVAWKNIITSVIKFWSSRLAPERKTQRMLYALTGCFSIQLLNCALFLHEAGNKMNTVLHPVLYVFPSFVIAPGALYFSIYPCISMARRFHIYSLN